MKRKNPGDKENDEPEVEETSIRRRINFDKDSDDEISFNCQAHKRRKLSKEMEELKTWFTKELNTRMSDQTKTIMDSLNVTNTRSLKNEEDISQIKGAISRIENSLSQNGSSYAGAVLMSRQALAVPTQPVPPAKLPAEMESFRLSRRSLRIWPIEGENEKEMTEALTAFCCQALGARISELGLETVKRVKSAPRGVAYLEVLATFADNYTRDEILMRGPMLMQYRDKDNKPTAGIRLDIPAHLMGSFKTLESFGYSLKKKHGTAFRKHIKFDDMDFCLYIQVGIKREDTEMEWTNYSAAEAKAGLKTLQARRGPRFDFLASPPSNSSQSSSLPLAKSNTLRPARLPAPRGPSTSTSSTAATTVWNPPPRMSSQRSQSWAPAEKPDDMEFEDEDI